MSSTGIPQYDKRKAQKKENDRQRRSIHGDFSEENMTPTPEQIEKRRLRDEKEAKENARLFDRRHKGGYSKTKAGKSRKGNNDTK